MGYFRVHILNILMFHGSFPFSMLILNITEYFDNEKIKKICFQGQPNNYFCILKSFL